MHHPVHYNSHPSGVEAIDLCEHLMSCAGAAFKYVHRTGLKGDQTAAGRDVAKAAWYLRAEADLRAHGFASRGDAGLNDLLPKHLAGVPDWMVNRERLLHAEQDPTRRNVFSVLLDVEDRFDPIDGPRQAADWLDPEGLHTPPPLDWEGTDAVVKPAYYTSHPSGIEQYLISRWLRFNLGSAFKYLVRLGGKDIPIQELSKTAWYLRREAERRRTYPGLDDRMLLQAAERDGWLPLLNAWLRHEPDGPLKQAQFAIVASGASDDDGVTGLLAAAEIVNSQALLAA